MSLRNTRLTGRMLVIVLLLIGALIALVPIVWLVAASTKTSDDMFHFLFFPPLSKMTASNYHDLFTKAPFARYLVNSVFVTSTTVIVQLFFSSLAGFALAKYEFKGKNVIMVTMLATLLLPAQLTMAPLYDMLFHLGMVDKYTGLIVPGAVSVFGIFLFRQSIAQVPDELLQAARIDGCTEFKIYWDIVMPVSRPMVGAFCLISFMGAWNSFLWPQIILHHAERFTLPIGLNQLATLYTVQYGMLMAGTLISIVPVVVLFMLLQREFVAGLTAGAVKG